MSFEDEARTIETPTLVIAPGEDRPMTPDWVRARIADVIGGSRFEVVPESGHYVVLEHPKRVAALIDEFVAAL